MFTESLVGNIMECRDVGVCSHITKGYYYHAIDIKGYSILIENDECNELWYPISLFKPITSNRNKKYEMTLDIKVESNFKELFSLIAENNSLLTQVEAMKIDNMPKSFHYPTLTWNSDDFRKIAGRLMDISIKIKNLGE